MNCEKCGQEHDGKYASGRFCSKSCASSFSSFAKRQEINKKVSEKLKGRKVGGSFSIGHKQTEKNKESLRLIWIAKYNCYIDRWKIGLETGLDSRNVLSRYIRRYIMTKYDNKCSTCGWNVMNSYTKLIPLQIHHVDGKYLNTDEENLFFLCPNCHSQTLTFKAKNSSVEKRKRAIDKMNEIRFLTQRRRIKSVANVRRPNSAEVVAKRVVSLNKTLRDKMINTDYEFLGPILGKRKIMEEQDFRCPLCGISEEWNGKPLVFEIDHRDGHSSNESRENIRFICPNCHSLTQFYGGANRETEDY
jgi:predicted RNA-binding Zn-ribbon protein involved in translation (DUF1610 family)